MQETLAKKERLKSKKAISTLFSQRQFNKAFPLKMQYQESSLAVHQFAVVVPKRLHKLAVDRNKIKRQIREAYRQQKQVMPSNSMYQIMFIYTSPKPVEFKQIYKAVGRHINFLNQL